MKQAAIKCLLIGVAFCLTACAPVSSEFSCNKTAGDSCLTIEQVDAMTRYADAPLVMHKTHKSAAKKNLGATTSTPSQLSKTQKLYPYDQDKGVWIARNEGVKVYANIAQ